MTATIVNEICLRAGAVDFILHCIYYIVLRYSITETNCKLLIVKQLLQIVLWGLLDKIYYYSVQLRFLMVLISYDSQDIK